jgi:4-amino-4-deoxy-L-arabinose transferase-like glycosyltransferase
VAAPVRPDSGIHKALLLWGGWLLTCVVFFSMVSGIFHSYYAIMLVPPLGAVVGIGFAQLWRWGVDKTWARLLLIAAAAITVGFQIFASSQYGEKSVWIILAGLLLIAGSLLMVVTRRTAHATILAAMLVIPAYWTVMTIASDPNIKLPTAYQGVNQGGGPDGVGRARQQGNGPASNVNAELVAYLEENTQDVEYLVAVPSSQTGAPLVLATGRPVLYMGGFGGQDEVVSAGDLDTMVRDGELLYVLYGGDRGGRAEIAAWLEDSCFVIHQFSGMSSGYVPSHESNGAADDPPQAPGSQAMSLYMCR